MKILNPGWNFNSVHGVEFSSQLNSKLISKVTLQLHVKRYIEMKFRTGMKISNLPHNRHFSQLVIKIWYYGRANSLLIFFKKIKIATSQGRFKWTDGKLNFIKYLQKSKSSMEFRSCNSKADKVKLFENVRKRLNR